MGDRTVTYFKLQFHFIHLFADFLTKYFTEPPLCAVYHMLLLIARYRVEQRNIVSTLIT